MSTSILQTEVRLGPQGRVVIPAQHRRALGLELGDTLVVRVENEQLVMEKPGAIKQRLKARFAQFPKGKSLATELLAERRKEAKRENKR